MKFERRGDQAFLTFDGDDVDSLAWWADEKLREEIVRLRKANEQLGEAVTRCQKQSNADLDRRRKAEWEVLKLRDEIKSSPEVKALKHEVGELQRALDRQKVANNINCERIREYAHEVKTMKEAGRDLIDSVTFDPKDVYDLSGRYYSKPELLSQLLLALCELRDDFDKIGAGGWRDRVVEIIRMAMEK